MREFFRQRSQCLPRRRYFLHYILEQICQFSLFLRRCWIRRSSDFTPMWVSSQLITIVNFQYSSSILKGINLMNHQVDATTWIIRESVTVFCYIVFGSRSFFLIVSAESFTCSSQSCLGTTGKTLFGFFLLLEPWNYHGKLLLIFRDYVLVRI